MLLLKMTDKNGQYKEPKVNHNLKTFFKTEMYINFTTYLEFKYATTITNGIEASSIYSLGQYNCLYIWIL